MNLERWEPFRDVVSLRDAVNSLLQESFVRPNGGPGSLSLPLDVVESDQDFIVKASLPGVKPDDVQITIQGDLLTIRGETKSEEEKKGHTWHMRERRHGSFQRSVGLGFPVSTEKAQAKFENGVLTLTLPKSEEAKPKQIRITATKS